MTKHINSDHQSSPIPDAPAVDSEDEITMLDLLIVLAKHMKLIIGLPVIAGVAAVVWILLVPNTYTASTKLLPPQQSQSTAAGMLAQLGGLVGFAGVASGVKSPSDTYVGMLRSRTVADAIIARFDLNTTFERKLQSDTRQVLQNMTMIKTERDGMITIGVEYTDPKQAAALANAYIDELYKLTNVLAVTEASQRRLFFERQLAQAKDNLVRAEISAKRSLEKGGIMQVEGQGRAMLEATARLRGQITVKEVQIGAMRTFAADRNPELILAQHELDVLKRELAKLEGGGAARARENGAPNNSQGIDSLSSLRDMKYYETIYEMLAKQFELAKIDEAKDSAIIQVLDKAIEPDRKSGPNRRNFVVLWVVAALSIAIVVAFVLEAMSRVNSDPRQAQRIQSLKRYLSWR